MQMYFLTTVMRCSVDVLSLSLPTCPGSEHDPVHPESGPAHPEGPAVRAEDGGPVAGPGDQVPTGGGEPQAEHGQTVQGTATLFTHNALRPTSFLLYV